jgi:hypothetical protein
MAFLCFDLPPGSFDVNVTPDKRSVFIQREVAIMNALGQVRLRLCYSECILCVGERVLAVEVAITNALEQIGL